MRGARAVVLSPWRTAAGREAGAEVAVGGGAAGLSAVSGSSG